VVAMMTGLGDNIISQYNINQNNDAGNNSLDDDD
jgi:hypothetical protein